MKFFSQDLILVCFNKLGDAHAVKMAMKGRQPVLLDSAYFPGGEGLEEIRSSLDIKVNDAVVLCDDGSFALDIELTLPKLKDKELYNAVQFALASKLPVPVDQMKWGYFRKEGQLVLSLIKNDSWDDFLINSKGLSFDFFIASSSVEEKQDISGFLDTVLQIPGSDEAVWRKSISLAQFCLSHDLKSLKKTSIQAPENQKLRHYFVTQYLSIFCVIYLVFALLSSLVDYTKDYKAHKNQLLSRLEQVVESQAVIPADEYAYVEKLNNEYVELDSTHPWNLVDVLNEIARLLPQNCYLKDFRSDGTQLTCQILSSSGELDIGELYKIFKTSDIFSDDIPISRRGNQIQVNLKLVTGGEQ